MYKDLESALFITDKGVGELAGILRGLKLNAAAKQLDDYMRYKGRYKDGSITFLNHSWLDGLTWPKPLTLNSILLSQQKDLQEPTRLLHVRSLHQSKVIVAAASLVMVGLHCYDCLDIL